MTAFIPQDSAGAIG